MNEERAQIITKTILKIAIFLMATMAIFIFFASIVTGYEEIVTCFLRKYDKLHQIDQFKQYYLTKTRFHLIQSAIAAVIIILLFVLVKIEKVSRVVAGGVLKLWAGISDLYLDIKLTLKELPTKYKAVGLALLVISLITKLYYIAQFPLTEDEVFSYVYLVEKGLGVSAVYYPGPNNHILYSLSCVFIDIFVDNPRWIMRLPALLASLCLPLLFFYFAAKLTDRGVAFLASALSLFSAHILHYSFHGRGYIYIILFTVIALFSVILYLKARQNRWLVLSGVSSVLGFYTIPIFLYPFVSVYFYLFIVVLLKKDFKELRKVIFVIALIAFFTGLLYAPVILLNGFNAIVNNSWVAPMAFSGFLQTLPKYITKVYFYLSLTDTPLLLWPGLLLIIGGGFYLFRLNKHLAAILMSLIFIPVIILLIQRVQPFERVWTYMIPYMLLLISGSLIKLLQWIAALKKDVLVCVVTLIFMGYSTYKVESRIRKGFPYYESISDFETYFNQTPVQSYLVTDPTYHLFVRYFALLQKRSINISTNLDKGNFDMLVLPQTMEIPLFLEAENYKLSYTNSYIKVYLRK